MRRKGFTLTELIVVIVVTLAGFTFALAAVQELDTQDARIKCARNLRQIGQALLLYSNDNKGPYPRTIYDMDHADKPKFFTGINAPDPFGAGGPEANDVTAAMFLLMRTEDITSVAFVCPATKMHFDVFGGGTNNALNHSNFSLPENLSYSYADPYPGRDAFASGYKLVQGLDPTFAVAADINPGGDALTKLNTQSTDDETRKGNTPNHSGDGQNVLFGDGHIEFQNSPFCGTNRDNIYTYGDSGNDPDTQKPFPTGGAGIIGSPTKASDSVLLPVAVQQSAQQPDANK